jgi:DNA repair protein RecO (recombination protein O)
MSSGTLPVSVVLVGIGKETTPTQISHEVLLECDASSHRFAFASHSHDAPIAPSKVSHNNLVVETTVAILLRRRKFSDTSLIVSWCTESLGCIQTVARGARRAKSPFAGKLDLFFEAEIQIARSRKSNLHTLTEVVLRNPFAGIRRSYLRTQTAAYFVELIEICTERDHHEPELFALLRRAFNYLDANDPNLRAVTHFETELARIAGVHDTKILTNDPAFALGNLFGKLPLSRTPLLKTLATHNKDKK